MLVLTKLGLLFFMPGILFSWQDGTQLLIVDRVPTLKIGWNRTQWLQNNWSKMVWPSVHSGQIRPLSVEEELGYDKRFSYDFVVGEKITPIWGRFLHFWGWFCGLGCMISSVKENSETSRGSKQHNHDERANVGGDSCGGSATMRQQQQAVTGTIVTAQ